MSNNSWVQALARNISILLFFLFVCLTTTFGSSALAEENEAGLPPELIARAQILVSKGQTRQAYEYMAPYEAVGADILEYNYLYGVAALDSGHPSVAALALQRALIQNPEFSAARMELARAYYELGDYEGARREFRALRKDEPPPLAYTAILNYLSAIDRESSRYRPGLNYYIQGGVGYDSNANGATDTDTFLVFRLDEKNVAQSSGYFEVAYGYGYHHPLNERFQAIITGNARHRRNPSAEFVDMDRIRGELGLHYDDGLLSVRSVFAAARTELEAGYAWDGEFNNADYGFEASLRRQLRIPEWYFVADGRLGRVEYRQAIDIQDVDQQLVAAGFEWSEGRHLYRRIGAMLILGNEDARESGSPYGRNQYGFRIYGSRQIHSQLWFLAKGGILASNYDGRFFGDSRDDNYLHAIFGLDWRPFVDPRWSVQPHFSYYKNSSSVELFDYDRIELGVTFRWVSG